MTKNGRIFYLTAVGVLVLSSAPGAQCQKSGTPAAQTSQTDGAPLQGAPGERLKSKVGIDARIARQKQRIGEALQKGAINQDQANKLRAAVKDIEDDVKGMRTVDGGTLKPEQRIQIQNSLNQSDAMIRSIAEAGEHSVQSGDVLGAKWKKGPDGAQNPKSLLKEMRQENRRELRQEKQALEQKVEQQQLQYEKEMVEGLGDQRSDIIKNKNQLKEVRKDSGAD